MTAGSATFLIGIATTGVMYFGGSNIIQGKLTIGEFIEFTVILGLIIAPIVQMSNIGVKLREIFH